MILKMVIKTNLNDHHKMTIVQLINYNYTILSFINNKNSVYINEKQKLTSTVKKLTIVVKLQSSWYIFHVHIQYTIDNSESLQMYYITRRYIHMYIRGIYPVLGGAMVSISKL